MVWTVSIGMALLFGAADRLAGGDYVAKLQGEAQVGLRTLKPKWLAMALLEIVDARSTFWATLTLASFLAILGLATPYGARLAVLALAFAAWRWDGWTVFGGGIDPKTAAERKGLFLRQLFAVPAYALAVLWLCHGAFLQAFLTAVSCTAFAVWATCLGALLAREERPGIDLNAGVETVRCIPLGLVLGMILTGLS